MEPRLQHNEQDVTAPTDQPTQDISALVEAHLHSVRKKKSAIWRHSEQEHGAGFFSAFLGKEEDGDTVSGAQRKRYSGLVSGDTAELEEPDLEDLVGTTVELKVLGRVGSVVRSSKTAYEKVRRKHPKTNIVREVWRDDESEDGSDCASPMSSSVELPSLGPSSSNFAPLTPIIEPPIAPESGSPPSLIDRSISRRSSISASSMSQNNASPRSIAVFQPLPNQVAPSSHFKGHFRHKSDGQVRPNRSMRKNMKKAGIAREFDELELERRVSLDDVSDRSVSRQNSRQNSIDLDAEDRSGEGASGGLLPALDISSIIPRVRLPKLNTADTRPPVIADTIGSPIGRTGTRLKNPLYRIAAGATSETALRTAERERGQMEHDFRHKMMNGMIDDEEELFEWDVLYQVSDFYV